MLVASKKHLPLYQFFRTGQVPPGSQKENNVSPAELTDIVNKGRKMNGMR
jgi:surfactin synthase thioesterase subunit